MDQVAAVVEAERELARSVAVASAAVVWVGVETGTVA